MPGTDTFYDTLAEYLTIRLGQASLGPAGTVILVLTLAAALLSAFAPLAASAGRRTAATGSWRCAAPRSTEPFASGARAGTSGSAASSRPARLSVPPSNSGCSVFSLPPASRGMAAFRALSRASSAAPSYRPR